MTIDSSLGEAKPLLRVLAGERLGTPPIWFMRQAGRYLPEYRELRTRAKTFLDFCYAPALATEAVMQPLRRFDLDAAILFSDILVVPHALGRDVSFVEGEGPRLPPLLDETGWRFEDAERAIQRLAPVYETVERIAKALPPKVALIGFCGAPWTVATYMLQGRGGEKDVSRRGAYERPGEVDALLDVLVETTARHLVAQAQAGAEVLQIFESWAEGLSEPLFERLVLRPNAALVARVRALGVTAPIIGFPRGAGHHLARYAAETGVTAVGVDTSVPVARVRGTLPARMALQGNLDPQLLIVGGEPLKTGVAQVLKSFGDSPHIFNLGHGVTPDAKPEHVTEMIAAVREGVQ
ncbi:MAG: uroporphyrinogen decarboxylase [Hyphomonadaceae bacterium]|nr:MAG: uroporphyrinogen decarboxylase [Caulobacteraceae bacterium]MBT9444523.1 uroporphyrinogen decarboxylase [Hyphomonadaceae bacterium]TPW07814.1 MAG: uroporphyrinogen decarboxylase [Alphaproteobacteria bacterium]